MTAYAFVTLNVNNPEKMTAYREKAADALAKHGGSVLQASPEPMLLEGETTLPQMAVGLGFPDRDSAIAWKNDPDLAEVHALRMDSGETTIILL
jgi:uncharacterized protein (DUF1330 family)